MGHIVGCVEAHELSTCKQGANQHAHIILRKSMTPKDQTQPTPEKKMATAETHNVADVMKAAAAIALKLASLTDVAKAHVTALAEDAQQELLQKSAAEIEAVAKAAKEEADKKASEEEARKAGVTARELELQKRADTLQAEVEALKAKDVERDLEKRAADEFAGYPGGVTEAVNRLKSIGKLPVAEQQPLIDMMKAQCAMAAESLKHFGGRTEAEVTKASAAKTRLEEAAKAYMADASNKCTDMAKALEVISEMPKHAADVEAAFG